MPEEAKLIPADLLKVPFSLMRLDPENERQDFGDMEWLIQSIRDEGVKAIMDGYKAKEDGLSVIYIRDGSRRFKAMEAIYDNGNGPDIIAFVKTYDKKLVNKEQSVVDRLIRNEGKPFTALEKAHSVAKLLSYNWDVQKIADKLGMSVQWVNNMALLNAAPQNLKNLIQENRISATTVIQTLPKGEEAVNFIIEKANEKMAAVPESGADLFTIHDSEIRGSMIKDPGTPVIRPKITAKDLTQGVNSLKEYKEWAKYADKTKMNPGPRLTFELLCKIFNNEVKKSDFDDFFY